MFFAISFIQVLTFSCNNSQKNEKVLKNEAVIYTSLDQVFSEPILKKFERLTGIHVKAVYDTEATKTTGLVNRLIAEKDNPKADVFWNSEICRTIILKRKDILVPYFSPSAKGIPNTFKDPEGYWTGFAARARVLIYNKNLISKEEMPKSIFHFNNPKWNEKFCMAYPLFGTTATHIAALFSHIGDDQANDFLKSIKENNVQIVDGNSTARDRVVSGVYPVGFTDTDDVNVAILSGAPVDMIFPDQGQNEMGTLLIPNTVALIKGGPNPENSKKFIDFVLSKETELMLSEMQSAQIPLHSGLPRPPSLPSIDSIKFMNVDYEKVADKLDTAMPICRTIFIR